MTPRPIAIVTGASRGIGAEAAVEFARRGYDLALTARGVEALAEVVPRVQQAGGQAFAIPGDLADLAFAESVVKKTIDRFGRVDVLVNNAAWRELVTMRTITPESWEKTLRVCLTSPAFMARAAAADMEKRKKGVIINVSSIQSRLAGGMAPAYIAAKGAIDALTYDLATLYGPSGVRVVAINPGAIDTEMSNDYQDPTGQSVAKASRDFSCDMIPLRRWGSAAEIARTIVMLAGDDAAYITGTTIVVDGGWSHQISPYRIKGMMFPTEFQ